MSSPENKADQIPVDKKNFGSINESNEGSNHWLVISPTTLTLPKL